MRLIDLRRSTLVDAMAHALVATEAARHARPRLHLPVDKTNTVFARRDLFCWDRAGEPRFEENGALEPSADIGLDMVQEVPNDRIKPKHLLPRVPDPRLAAAAPPPPYSLPPAQYYPLPPP